MKKGGCGWMMQTKQTTMASSLSELSRQGVQGKNAFVTKMFGHVSRMSDYSCGTEVVTFQGCVQDSYAHAVYSAQ